MNPQRLLFGIFYRLGFTPWEGHHLSSLLVDAVEKWDSPRGAALDIGCGTGDGAIFLAQHGFSATGIDLVDHALRRAANKAKAAGVEARFLNGDVTRLGQLGLGPFQLIVDTVAYHGLQPELRAAYAREVSAVASSGARFFMSGLPAKKRLGPPGFDRAEIEARFGAEWEIVAIVEDPSEFRMHGGDHLQLLELRRR
jgi:ribosomal protein L11 methylase PrmA